MCFLPDCQHILLGYLSFPQLQSIDDPKGLFQPKWFYDSMEITARSELTLGWVILRRDGCRASQDLQNHELHGTFSECLLTCHVSAAFFSL